MTNPVNTNLDAATKASIAEVERLEALPPATTTGPTEAQVTALINKEHADLLASIHGLYAGTTPPVEPPPIFIPPPTPTGFVELGKSGYPDLITPDYHGHLIKGDSAYWNFMFSPAQQYPKDADSDRLIQRIGGDSLHPDWGAGPAADRHYGMPINIVPGNQPMVPVITVETSETVTGPCPIPLNPSIEGWLSDVAPTSLAEIQQGSDADHHMTILVRDEVTGGFSDLWEMYNNPWFDGVSWHVNRLHHWNFKDGLPGKDGETSSDASGMPVASLNLTFPECESGRINHSLRMTMGGGNCKGKYIWPARHAAGGGGDGIPFGARMRITQAWHDAHINEYTGHAKVIVTALYEYGAFLTDISIDMFLTGVSDARFDHDNIETLKNVPSTAFEICQIIPQFTLQGPTQLALGGVGQYKVVTNPLVDPNGAHGYYLHAYEKGPNGWVKLPGENPDPHHIGLNNGVWTLDFAFTPPDQRRSFDRD